MGHWSSEKYSTDCEDDEPGEEVDQLTLNNEEEEDDNDELEAHLGGRRTGGASRHPQTGEGQGRRGRPSGCTSCLRATRRPHVASRHAGLDLGFFTAIWGMYCSSGFEGFLAE